MSRGMKRPGHHEEPDEGEPVASADQQGATAASSFTALEELAILVNCLAWWAQGRPHSSGRQFSPSKLSTS